MKRLYFRIFWLFGFSLCFGVIASLAQSSSNSNGGNNTARGECFPFERLPAAARKKAEEMLLKALDGEALYTIVGGLKPMSSGFQTFQMPTALPRVAPSEAERAVRELGAKKPDELTNDEKRRLAQAQSAVERQQTLERLAETRLIFEHWRCGGADVFADVHPYYKTYEGKRFFDTVVFSSAGLRKMLGAKADFFSRWGITENSHPLAVLYAVEADETAARFGGYGYLFGYPDYAVRFFAEASNEEEFSGNFVERSFYSLPTFAGERRFVYAVPLKHTENDADKALRERAELIFDDYRRRRSEYIGAGKKGVVEMLRDWFCTAPNQCSAAAVILQKTVR